MDYFQYSISEFTQSDIDNAVLNLIINGLLSI